jgi:hypothetical protein
MDYKARFFDVSLGRFLQPDSIVPGLGNPQNLNRYSYVGNSPTNFADPTGHQQENDDGGGVSCQILNNCSSPSTGGGGGGGNNSGSGGNTGNQNNSDNKPEDLVNTVVNGYMSGWTTFGAAWSNTWNPNASIGSKMIGNVYMSWWLGGHVVLAVGVGMLTYGLIAPTAGICGMKPECDQEVGSSVNQFWTQSTNFLGNKVYQRPDLVQATSENLERMRNGRPPIGPDGFAIQLHHMLQTMDGPLAEVTQTFHQTYGKILNINPNTIGSVIDRSAFATWRASYWIQRATDLLSGQ